MARAKRTLEWPETEFPTRQDLNKACAQRGLIGGKKAAAIAALLRWKGITDGAAALEEALRAENYVVEPVAEAEAPGPAPAPVPAALGAADEVADEGGTVGDAERRGSLPEVEPLAVLKSGSGAGRPSFAR